MASNAGRQPRGYTQDYIARIRYSNALPPPSMPPKLLNIRGPGLSQYLVPSFTGRVAREQPLNIEADAELGMRLDLVGMPGVFEGDETCLQASDPPVASHPNDKPLLRPLSALGKAPNTAPNATFLRRPEPMSTNHARGKGDPFLKPTKTNVPQTTGTQNISKKRRIAEVPLDDPSYVLKTIIKGFEIANPDSRHTGPDSEDNIRGIKPTQAELDAWNNPQHPTKKNAKLVNSFPVLPDLNAYPDTAGYIVVKFATNPVPPSDTYDHRLDVALLRPLELRPEMLAQQQAATMAYVADPSNPPPGPPPFDYEFFVPKHGQSLENIKRSFDPHNPQRDDPTLYSQESKDTSKASFRYERLRAYETVTASGSVEKKFQEVAVTIYDPAQDERSSPSQKRQKAAYYHPILQKSHIRSRRTGNMVQAGMRGAEQDGSDEDDQRVDYLDLQVRDANQDELSKRAEHRRQYDPMTPAADVAVNGEAEQPDQTVVPEAAPENAA